MKLRIHDQSIRLRLNRREVAQFQEAGVLETSVDFAGGGQLSYGVESAEDVTSPRVMFAGGRLRVRLPRQLVTDWAGTDQVAIEGPQVLIEKDFQCMHKDGSRDPDAYPNPMAGRG